MNEADARKTLLVRAFEAPLAAPWSEADRDWATREALLREGAQAAPDRLIATRAALAAGRLAQRLPAAAAALAATAPGALSGSVLLAAAFGVGVALDSLGARGRIEILSPPLVALLVWNLAVYLWLIGFALRADPAGAARRERAASAGGAHGEHGWPRGWLRALAAQRWQRSAPHDTPALARFFADWAAHGRPLHAARIATLLHAAAALLALGALASLYLRGLVFEFRAGWDSTFLDAGAVHALAAALYGPAALVSGVALPDAGEIARLRFAHGGGENAARWIHLQALTVAGAIVVPRAVLAAVAQARAARLARDFPLSLDDAYCRRLLPLPAAGVAVCVLPCGYRFPAERAGALQRAIEQQRGERIVLRLGASMDAGRDDDAGAPLAPQAAGAAAIVALFALAATPERETHGAFVRALAQRVAPHASLQALVDETDFVARFGAAGEPRRAQRRDAWRRLLASEGLEPVFVDLAAAKDAA